MHCELKKWLGYVGVILFTLHCSLFAVSCSEDEGEPAEFDNWQYRNDAAVVEWAANGSYRKIRTYTQDEATDGANSDFIYVEVLETGAGKASPSRLTRPAWPTAAVSSLQRPMPKAMSSMRVTWATSTGRRSAPSAVPVG